MKHAITVDNVGDIRFNDDGLVPVIAQDQRTGAVLMLAWANEESLRMGLDTGRMTYWSRSRGELWKKGATSGNTQRLVTLCADCDQDAVLAVVEQHGPSCHEGTTTCWSHRDTDMIATELGVIDRMAAARLDVPQDRYTDSLLADPAFAASKVVEEAGEVAAVLRGEDNDDTLEHEAADLLYHLVVALRAGGTDLGAVLAELRKRS